MRRQSIILVGGGGHCRACIEVIESEGRFTIAGIVDRPERRGERVLGYEVVGCDDELAELVGRWKNALVTVGSIGATTSRARLFDLLLSRGAALPTIVARSAVVSRHAFLAEGTIVMHRAVVNAGARIGRNCIINTASLVEHDARIDDNCHISTGAIVNGDCRLGRNVFLGSNAVLRNGVSVCADAVIGAGTVVVRSLEVPGTYVGVPGRLLSG